MNEDTNYLLPGLDDNDEDGPGISYVHPPRIRQLNRNEWFDNGHEVIPFPSYTTHYLETRHTLHSTQVQEGLPCGVVAAMVVLNETNRRGSAHRHSMVLGRNAMFMNLARPPAQARSGSIMDELD